MRDNLKKITIKGASGWGPVDLAYDDKLTIKPDGISYEQGKLIVELEPVIQAEAES